MALLAAVTGCAMVPPQAQPLPASTVEVAEGSWESMPEAPLSPRGAAAAVWTGEHLLLLGGQRTDAKVPECPPAADCAAPPGTGLGDGAAWDPGTRTWTYLRSPLPDGPPGASALSGNPGVWSGTQVLTRGAAVTPDLAAGTLEVDALELGPALVYADPVWTGRELVGIGWDYGGQASRVDGQLVAQVLDPATGQRRSVPWPFNPPGAESVRTVWTGKEVVAFVAVQTPGGTGTRVVAFDSATDTWRLITDTTDLPFSVAWDGEHVQVVTESRLLALDPTSGTVTSTTALPDGRSGTLLASPEGQLLLQSWKGTYLLAATPAVVSPVRKPAAAGGSGAGCLSCPAAWTPRRGPRLGPASKSSCGVGWPQASKASPASTPPRAGPSRPDKRFLMTTGAGVPQAAGARARHRQQPVVIRDWLVTDHCCESRPIGP